MNNRIIIVAAVMLAAGLAGGYWMAATRAPHGADATQTRPQAASERKVLFWRNPMNPAITSPVFMKDEMGMDYIAVYADAGGDDVPVGTVKIDPVTVQNIGVRTALAEQRALTRKVRAPGRVTYDEQRLAKLSPKTEGWIEKLFIDKVGDHVTRDTMLLSFYSPQLVSSQQEYLLALKNREALGASPYPDIREGAEELWRSARSRLELLDVPEHQLRELERDRRAQKTLHIHSPFDGVVLSVGAREGQFVTPMTELYSIADLSRVWVFVDVYEDDLPWVRVGDAAEMRVAAVPGRVYRGRVSYIYPFMESRTRTVRVRLEFDNPERLLKPEMYAEVALHSGRRDNAVVVPDEAVVRSGDREQVFVTREAGRFEPRAVRVGLSTEGYTEILEGLRSGERVLTSSQFLIDSESKLREATAKLLGTGAPGAVDADMDMGDMTMDDVEVSP